MNTAHRPAEIHWPEFPGVKYAVLWAPIKATTIGDTIVIPKPESGSIFYRVLNAFFVASIDVAIAWKSGGDIVIPPQDFIGNGGIVVQPPYGWFMDCYPGRELTINLSVAARVSGALNYAKVSV